jgi:hypothetical protein
MEKLKWKVSEADSDRADALRFSEVRPHESSSAEAATGAMVEAAHAQGSSERSHFDNRGQIDPKDVDFDLLMSGRLHNY